MTTDEHFMLLRPLTMDACSLSSEAYEAARATWLCAGCCVPRLGVEAIDVHVNVGAAFRKSVMTFVSGCGVGLAHRDFLANFPASSVENDLWLGNVYDNRNGNRVNEWATFHAKNRIVVRGTKYASYRKCTDCGRVVYFATGSHYLFPAPPNNAEIFEHYCDLIVSGNLFASFPVKSWRLIDAERLLVANEPYDSLGILE